MQYRIKNTIYNTLSEAILAKSEIPKDEDSEIHTYEEPLSAEDNYNNN